MLWSVSRCLGAAVLAVGLLAPATTAAQVCPPDNPVRSLVRIERQQRGNSGSGIVVAKRDDYVIVLTARHVIQNPSEPVTVYFEADTSRAFPVPWTDENMFGFPQQENIDLAVFRVNGEIPEQVVPVDPFLGDVPQGVRLTTFGYPQSRPDNALCGYAALLRSINAGFAIADRNVECGVSGGPMFWVLDDGTIRLVGISVAISGDCATAPSGTDVTAANSQAITVRSAVDFVRTSRDPRNGNAGHPWPNIVLPDAIPGGRLLSQLRKVPAGEFLMGSNRGGDERWPDAARGDDGQARLDLPVFYMGRYEVTVAQYRECPPLVCRVSYPEASRGSDDGLFPVTGVSWRDAMGYAGWIRDELRRDPQLPEVLQRLLVAGWTVTLPSEAEFEKASRRNGEDDFPWGSSGNADCANYETDRLMSVGARTCDENAYGLADIAGNVREWTRSLYRAYPYVAAEAEDDDDLTGNRAVRGGSYKRCGRSVYCGPERVRASSRQQLAPDEGDDETGFRIVLMCAPPDCVWEDAELP